MQVGDILRKRTARVATVRMNETVAIAAQLMRAGNIGALVVKDVVRTEGNTAVGMFTERDVVRAIAGGSKFAGDLYDVYDSGRLAVGSDGISIAPALDTTAAVIILALWLPCEPLSGPKSPKRITV